MADAMSVRDTNDFSDIRRRGGMRCWAKHGVAECPLCKGTGLVASEGWKRKGRKGGLRSYLVSLEPGHLSMVQRGRYGGRPGALKIEDIERRQAAPGPTPSNHGSSPATL